jgi:hypothetical protein
MAARVTVTRFFTKKAGTILQCYRLFKYANIMQLEWKIINLLIEARSA